MNPEVSVEAESRQPPGLDYQSPTASSPTINRARARLAALLLIILTAIWGSTFVVLKTSLNQIPPDQLMLTRFTLAAIVLSPFVRGGRRLWLAGLELGFWLWSGYMTQVVGLQYTTVNRSAFITSLAVIFVPAIAAARGRKVSAAVWIAAVMALLGVGLLSYDASRPNVGDAWTLACAVIYAIFIYRLEWAAGQFKALRLTAVSMIVVAILSAGSLAIRHPAIGPMPWKAVLYLGVICTAITTTLQTIGQKWLPAPQVGVIYTMEPLFASMFGYLVLGELLGSRGWAGAAMIIAAAVLCQWPAPVAVNPPPPESE